MSYHIIHVLGHGSVLSADRGCLVCRGDSGEKRAPLSDILAVIVAARGVSFSSDAISRIVSNKGIVLHCDENYRPCGKTVPLPAVIHQDIFARQISLPPATADAIWIKILRAKTLNQAAVLDCYRAKHELHAQLSAGKLDEGNAARHYWGRYFALYGRRGPATRETRGAEHPVNQMLNYSYAVISAIIHRSMLAHGLNPELGVHHRFRFKAEPLLYDAMEPLRPVCDLLLLNYFRANRRRDMGLWVKQVAMELLAYKLEMSDGRKFKLLTAIDRYIESLGHTFQVGSAECLDFPLIKAPNTYGESE
ncbi:MAG TPA: type II CRISPR-associated endonuclease Cas1 [Elusimicrobiales bacterium]|nr:type II CRISPR-associated endonuclease Cas1 [Elusimicrobiales bacterium]